jgi:dolichyl-diphosphooligosaccharide--protein glycosyltransferase
MFSACGILIVFFLCYFPSIKMDKGAIEKNTSLGDELYASLTWLRDNSPEPFNDPDYYYEYYTEPPEGQDYVYPSSAYGVAALWDYGHWITRIARRIPISNPFQEGASDQAHFMVSQDETRANEQADELGVKYILTDRDTTTRKFYSLPIWTGEDVITYYESFYQLVEGQLAPITLYYPEYFRSLAVRLYTFDGNAVEPEEVFVVSYDAEVDAKGERYNRINYLQAFPTYDEAERYVAQQPSGNFKIGSGNSQASPVRLEALQHYKLVYSSPLVSDGDVSVNTIPQVKIFEYVK